MTARTEVARLKKLLNTVDVDTRERIFEVYSKADYENLPDYYHADPDSFIVLDFSNLS